VPPLKDYPEEIESEDSNEGETPEEVEKSRVFNYDISRLEDEWRIFPGDFKAMQAFFMNYSEILPKKKYKEPDQLLVSDAIITQESFVQGWTNHINPHSTVIADIIYIHASKRREHIKFNFLEAINLFHFLFVSKASH
jgi:hypothetical protein